MEMVRDGLQRGPVGGLETIKRFYFCHLPVLQRDADVDGDHRYGQYPSCILLYYIMTVQGIHQFLVPEHSGEGLLLAILTQRVSLNQ